MLSDKEKLELLKIARQTLEIYLKDGEMPAFDFISNKLTEDGAAFVTLHRQGKLRGCIGMLQATEPLFQTVQNMVVAAALEDPRFDPVKVSELSEIDIEISVMSPMRRIGTILEIEVGRDGICVSKGPSRGVLLPQVAAENDWNSEEFLSNTCLKAGLDADTWQHGDVKIEIFSVELISEKSS